jgi:hypothetical protein
MRELADDPGAAIHPQTIVDRFGSWNEAKRRADLVPRRFATKDDLLRQLRELGEALGRTPTIKDLDANRKRMPSKSLYWQTFGSFTEALKQAGFAVVVGEERLDLAIERGAVIAQEIGRLPKFSDWKAARLADPTLPTEWQVYRLLDPTQGAWPTFQYFVRERLLEAGVTVRSDGRLVT